MSGVQAAIEKAAGWVSRRAKNRVPHDDANRFLEGPFAPVAAEATLTDLQVTGRIPSELNGLYARIGPNPIKVENPATHHWFLGDGMVHGVKLSEGKALWYRNRFVGADGVNRQLGRPLVPGPRHREIDTVNTNVIGHAGKIWALVEGGAVPMELDAQLETRCHSYFGAPLQRSFAAHPHRDPQTGALHAICYDVMVHDVVFYLVIGANGAVEHDVAIPVRHGPMIHDSALTASKIVVLDLPITFSMGAVLRGHSFPYQWNEKHPARVGLLPRSGTAADIVWYEVDPCFAFHAANAHDLADGSVVLDLMTYPKLFDGGRQGPEGSRSSFERWVLPAGGGAVKRTVLSDFLQEFPRCDERYTGQAYRYAYTVGIDPAAPGPEPLYRHDLHTGAIARHDFGKTHLPGETVFVPRTQHGAEDDGYLLTYVYDLAENLSTLTILDAAHLQAEPVATVHLPVRVPMGFHGNWIGEN